MATAKVLLAVLAVLAFDGLGVQVTSAPAQGSFPTALQLMQSELSSLPQWYHYLPDDIDTNNDGELSEEEVEDKVKNYMSEVFNQLDKDSNQVVIQDEVKNASLDVDFLNKIVDIAFKSYPIKTYLGHGDRNQDGFISEDDFYLADHSEKMKLEDSQEHCGGDCESMSYDYGDYNTEGWSMSSSFPVYGSYNYDKNPLCADSIGEKEADVLCREMGFKGVESLSSVSFDEYKETANERDITRYFEPYKSKFDCQGSESKLEECSKSEVDDSEYYKRGGDGYYDRWSKSDNCPFGKNQLASVTCALDTEIGPIHLAGGKVPSVGELHIGDKVYRGETSPEMAQVVCRELGFNQGTPKIIRSSLFYNRYLPKFDRKFECTGSEAKLSDCRQTLRLMSQYDYWSWNLNGIDCNPGEDLDEKYGRIDQRSFINLWEYWGRRLLFADTNGDEQVSMEELKTKSKEILEAVLHLLDQTNDGSFSVEDVSTLSLRLPDVTDVLNKLFDFITAGKGEFNPAFVFGPSGRRMDTDLNGRITLNEINPHLDSSQDEGLLLLLSKYLDTNQDGLVQSDELENYVKMIFNNLDVDESSTITLDDVFKFMKKSQFTCLQIEGVETFVEGWMELIGTQAGKLLEYFFTYLDLDSNGEITLDEFYNLSVCNQVDPDGPRWTRTPEGILKRIPISIQMDPHACRNFETFFYFDERPVVPNLKYTGRGLYLQRDGKDVQEKLANSLCMAMQPDF